MSFKKSRAYSVIFMFIISAIFAGLVSAIKVATAGKVEDNKKIAASKNLVLAFELMSSEQADKASGEELFLLLESSVAKYWIEGNNVIKAAGLADDDKGRYTIWTLGTKSDPEAYVFHIGGKGFWGPLIGLISVQPDGVTIRTVVWTQHTETPGLGARVEEDGYRAKFRGKKADPAKFTMVPEGTMSTEYEMDQITGATQTTQVGMGSFLPENFKLWQRNLPLLKKHLGID